jgi:hypothetical protein
MKTRNEIKVNGNVKDNYITMCSNAPGGMEYLLKSTSPFNSTNIKVNNKEYLLTPIDFTHAHMGFISAFEEFSYQNPIEKLKSGIGSFQVLTDYDTNKSNIFKIENLPQRGVILRNIEDSVKIYNRLKGFEIPQTD